MGAKMGQRGVFKRGLNVFKRGLRGGTPALTPWTPIPARFWSNPPLDGPFVAEWRARSSDGDHCEHILDMLTLPGPFCRRQQNGVPWL